MAYLMKGWRLVSRFNLIDEPWIHVVTETGKTELVSLAQLFKYAHQYKKISGDTQTQDFAVMRIVLSILHTVYSRFDYEGDVYPQVKLDENFIPIDEIEEEENYIELLKQTWSSLWEAESFSNIVQEYLIKMHDRFYLFDEDYPFLQVKAGDIEEDKISRKKASSVAGKNINRTISESGNKTALFSPRYDGKNNKNNLTEAELARWLITFQAYTGLSDKVIFGKEKYKSSKGWLFDIGGLYLEGKNLFETLMMNLILVHPVDEYHFNHQRPCWELSSEKNLENYFSGNDVDNLASLYTIWSRAIYIDPETDMNQAFSFDIVKLPDLNHENQFLEAMTTWRFNDTGDSKNKFTPRKHPVNQSMWRSFGLITLPNSWSDRQRQPGIIEWLSEIEEIIDIGKVSLTAISMRDDGNATSWVPVDEIYDSLTISDFILTDVQENHWVPRIHEAVEMTKKVVGFTYRNFIDDILDIRNVKNPEYRNQKVEELYFKIDQPFRDWISSIEADAPKEEKIFEWYNLLLDLVKKQANELVKNGSKRDYLGIKDDQGETKNIATAYNKFNNFIYKDLSPK